MRRFLLCLFVFLLSGLTLPAQEFVEHTVRWYEDAQTICNRYGCTLEELLSANHLRYSTDIQPKMKVMIPKKKPAPKPVLPAETQAETPAQTPDGSQTMPVQPAAQPASPAEHSVPRIYFNGTPLAAGAAVAAAEATPADGADSAFTPVKTQLRAGLMLPLKSKEGGSDNYNDFYLGALLALDEMARDYGLNVHLTVIDTHEEPEAYKKVKNCDFVIGPVGAEEMKSALSALPEQVTVVSPLNPRCEELAAEAGNFIQAPTPVSRQWKDCLDWIKGDFIRGDKFLVLYEKGSREVQEGSWINALVDSCGLEVIKYNYKILDGREVADALVERLSMAPDAVNRVLIASDNQAFVNDAVRNLRVLVHNGFRVALYAPAKIKSYETIEVENLHSVGLRMSCTYHVDYSRPAVQRFLMKYRALYNTEPGAFAFQGFDLMKYMLLLKSGSPEGWEQKASSERLDLLQESFLLERQGKGWVNAATRKVVYGPGYSIETYNNK
ncbi:MAG: hypothetical protein J6Y32_01225 [Bacteroidales bacterium]|nr:hypothetical protein [Bacteroidales bacterium]